MLIKFFMQIEEEQHKWWLNRLLTTNALHTYGFALNVMSPFTFILNKQCRLQEDIKNLQSHQEAKHVFQLFSVKKQMWK